MFILTTLKAVNKMIKIISREMIKPSLKSINQLKPFKISLLDQFAPSYYTPIVFFYQNVNVTSQNACTKLKDSLSHTLSTFYPLSGRLRDNLFVTSYDEGVPFTETRVKDIRLREFLGEPEHLQLLNQFFPCPGLCHIPDHETKPLVQVQMNFFHCGGVALGLCLSHKLIDGGTLKAFIGHWAAFASSERPPNDEIITPDFSETSLRFPPVEQSVLEPYMSQVHSSLYDAETIYSTRRFIFSANALDALKAKARSELVKNPSRVEMITSLIWKSSMAASRVLLSGSGPKLSLASSAVSVRNRINPPLPKYYIGNMLTIGLAACDLDDSCTMGLHEITALVRQSMNDDYLDSIQGENGLEALSKLILQRTELETKYPKKPDTLFFSSLIHFGFNDLDFGLGKPVWVGTFEGEGRRDFNDFALLKKLGMGNGVEVCISINKDAMSIMEKDPEFLEYALPNPPILMP